MFQMFKPPHGTAYIFLHLPTRLEWFVQRLLWDLSKRYLEKVLKTLQCLMTVATWDSQFKRHCTSQPTVWKMKINQVIIKSPSFSNSSSITTVWPYLSCRTFWSYRCDDGQRTVQVWLNDASELNPRIACWMKAWTTVYFSSSQRNLEEHGRWCTPGGKPILELASS